MFLQKNPLTMVGTIDRCWLFTFQSPPEWADAFLPDALSPVTHNDCAFWNVVVCHVSRMRPRGTPPALGLSYWHVAYRLYARFEPKDEPPIEGLYFVRSDCDSGPLAAAGNLMTDFHFHKARIDVVSAGASTGIRVRARGCEGAARLRDAVSESLPEWSAFDRIDEAAAFLKYKPYGLSVDHASRVNVVHITRDESAWYSRPVCVEEQSWSFFDDIPARPELCFEVDPIAYQWDRARIYPPSPARRLAGRLAPG
jgi:hypothetical protein